MSTSSSLAKNGTLQIGGKIFGTVFGLITFFFLLQFYGTEGYGYLTTAMTFVSLFAIIVDFGLTLTTTQMISEHGANEEKILGNLLTLRLITAFAFLSLAPIVALFIPSINAVWILVFICSAANFFGSVAQTFIGVFQKRLSLTLPVFAETANRSLVLVIVIATGYLCPSFAAVMAAFFFGGIVQFVIMLGGTARLVKLRPAIDFAVWKDIIVRSWPIGVSIFFNLLYLKGDIFFMSIFGVSAEIIGQYGSAYKVVDVVTMVPVTFMGLMLPLMTSAWTGRAKEKFATHFQNTFDLFALIAVPFAIGSIIIGVNVMTAVKPDLVLAGKLLAVLGPAAAIAFFGSLYGHVIVALQKQRIMTLGYMVVAALALAGYIIYIPLDGVWAAAWVTLISEVLIMILTFAVVTKTTRSLPNIRMFARAVFASVVMAGALILIPLPHAVLSALLGILVYMFAIMAMGGPNPKSLMRLFLPDKAPVMP